MEKQSDKTLEQIKQEFDSLKTNNSEPVYYYVEGSEAIPFLKACNWIMIEKRFKPIGGIQMVDNAGNFRRIQAFIKG